MEEYELQRSQERRTRWMEKKRRQRNSLTPEQRDSENSRRRARRVDENISPRNIQFESPTTENHHVVENQRDASTSTLPRTPMADITNHQQRVTHNQERLNREYLKNI